MSARDALEVLGLGSVPDPADLRGAYLAAVKRAHPDKPGGDADRLRRVIEAYETLKERRAPEPAPVFSDAASPNAPPPKPSSRRVEITPMQAVFGGVHSVPMRGTGDVAVRLPPGLRAGDLIAVSGVAMTIDIVNDERSTFVGADLCLRLPVDRAFRSTGGDLKVPTPAGPLQLKVSRQDATRGLVRVDSARLPAQARNAGVQMLIKLEPIAEAVYGETRTRTLLRRFTAAWAA
jgi:curved DNA-binding protein